MTHDPDFDYNRWLSGSHRDAEWFTYQARVQRVVDGDTLDLVVDMGFRTRRTIRVRLGGLDTSEVYGVKQDSTEYESGMVHMEFVDDWVHQPEHVEGYEWPFVVTTAKATGKYGRYVAVLVAKETGAVLNEDLVSFFPDVED